MAPRILITNDDGIDADALLPLADALGVVGAVDIIVPEGNWSGASHSITLRRPLRVRPTKLRNGRAAFMSDGSPTDCVRLAAVGFLPQRPDLVISGINRGANLGDDITYSGTVAAAMEGLISGIPSIAISIDAIGGNIDYDTASAFAALVARNILDRGFAPDSLLNINVPAIPRDEIAGVEVTRLGKRTYRDKLIERLDPFGNPYYWLSGPAVRSEAEAGTDIAAILAKKISVTPITLELTQHALISELGSWDWGWSAPLEVSAG